MIGFSTVMTVHNESVKRHYRACFETFLYTLNKNSKLNQKVEFNIFHLGGISDNDKKNFDILKHPNLELKYHLVDAKFYEDKLKGNPKFYSLESFKLQQYDRVIFFDCDLICLGDINELLTIDLNLGMVKEDRRPCFNAGVIIIGKENLNDTVYNNLINCKGDDNIFGADQKIYNTYFKHIQKIDKKWNTLITEVGDLKNVKLLHYIHKPYIEKSRYQANRYFFDIWFDYYFEAETHKV